MTHSSRYGFDETVERLTATIVKAGNTVFATIDQARAAREAGTALRPTTLIVFGNPKAGTPFMEAYPLVALELPLKLVVWQEAEGVRLAYTPFAQIAAAYGIVGMDDRVAAIDRAVATLVATVEKGR